MIPTTVSNTVYLASGPALLYPIPLPAAKNKSNVVIHPSAVQSQIPSSLPRLLTSSRLYSP